jgi:PrtD family type I secretion system ABC transporter
MSNAGPQPDLFRQAVRACRDLVLWAFVFSASVNLLYLAPSLFMLQVYDRVLTTGGLATLGFISVILLVALGVLAFLDMLRTRLLSRLSLRLDRILAPILVEAASPRDSSDAGRRQVMRDFDSLRQAVSGPAAIAMMDAPWAPIFVGVCFMIHPYIGLVALLGGAALILLAFQNERALRRDLSDIGDIAPRIYADQEADNASVDAVRAMGMRGAVTKRRLAQRSELNSVQTHLAFKAAAYAGLTKYLRLALQSAALGVGAWLAVERQISPGALIAGSILAARALSPLEQIVGAWRQIGQARLALTSVRAIVAEASAAPKRMDLPPPRGELSIDRVSVRIRGQFALVNASLSLAPGEVLGVLGSSGAGKSTLARITANALAPEAGVVRLDGANLADWDADALGRHIGYLPQEIGLLTGTIAENIRRFGEPTSADANTIDVEIIAAAKAAGAHELILRFPGGYLHQLGRGGSGLSPGQSQRIALARALYRSPPLIVLDEPNAHLDSDGEAALVRAVEAARTRGAAILIVAHRAGVLALADRLAVLREGRVELVGPRDEVMRKLAAATESATNLTTLRPREAQT